MFWLIPGTACFIVTYILSTLLGKVLISKNTELSDYQFKKDPYIYIFLMLALGIISVSFIPPAFQNAITPLKISQIIGAFCFSALIYLLFLFETNKLLNFSILSLSILSAFLFLNPDSLLLSKTISPSIERLIVGIILAGFVFSAKTLIGLPGIFSCFVIVFSSGLAIIALAGGLPIYILLVATLVLGVATSLFQSNRFDFYLKTNEGSLMSFFFLLGSLLLIGINEFAAPSVLILMTYPLSELIWCLIAQYILRRKSPDLYVHATYFVAYKKETDLTAVQGFVFKIGVINGALSLFQLYSPNIFTLPFLTFLINFWLISKLYNVEQPIPTLNQANTQLIQNIKDEITNVKQNFKKD